MVESGREQRITTLTEGYLSSMAQERGGTLHHCDLETLDLSGKNYHLESLDGLRHIHWEIKTLDVSNNALAELNLQNMNNKEFLNKIIASHNIISRVSLDLSGLNELDLSYNQLKKIPDLSSSAALNKLILSHNEINSGTDKLRALQKLSALDISDNKLKFGPSEFEKFISFLSRLENLNTLKINSNPFCMAIPGYEDYIISSSRVKELNGVAFEAKVIEQKKKKKLPSIEQIYQAISDVEYKRGQEEEFKQMPTIFQLYNELKEARNNPDKVSVKIDSVARQVENIMKFHERRYLMFQGMDQARIRMNIESFLQECEMIIEDKSNMRVPILKILATLAEVKEGNLGQECMNKLQDQLLSGQDVAEQMEIIIREKIVPRLAHNELKNINKFIIKGIIKMSMTEHDLSAIHERLIDHMINWIKNELEFAEKALRGISIDEDIDVEVHNYALRLMAVTAEDKHNAKKMEDNQITHNAAMLFKMMERETEPRGILARQEDMKDVIKRITALLELMENLAKNSKSSGMILFSEDVHEGILRDIMQYLDRYRSNGYSFSGSSGSTEKTEVMLYKLVGSYIDALTGLCKYNDMVDYLNSNTARHIRDEIFKVAIQPHVDPVLLASVLELIYEYISSSIMAKPENIEHFRKTTEALNKMVPLMHYLGGKKYKDICVLGEKYAQGTMVGQEPIQMSSLTNRYLHKLFISIIRLIEFFSKMANKSGPSNEIEEICSQISELLNNSNREAFLFNCLEVPQDTVKLAVVNCLDRIKTEEIDAKETGYIIRVLGNTKNLGVGKTEDVLSVIFLLLSKMITSEGTREIIITKFGEMVITECLSILERNSERDTKKNKAENEEKINLTLSALLFLKNASAEKDLRRYMKSNEEKLQRVLCNEERLREKTDPPVDIERTAIGSDIGHLINCLISKDPLKAYKDTSYRVISKIANILTFGPPPPTFKNNQLSNKPLKKLKEFSEEEHRNQLEKEDRAWNTENFVLPDYLQENQEDLQEFYKQHEKFASIGGFSRLLAFLMGHTRLDKYKVERKLQYSAEYTQDRLFDHMLNKREEFEKRYEEEVKVAQDYEKDQKNEEKKKAERSNASKKIIKKAMGEQDIGADPVIEEVQLEVRGVEQNEKLQIRARSLAAFLRCLYGALECAPAFSSFEVRHQMRNQVALGNLTKLCGTTKWKSSAVGAKYLRIARQVLQLRHGDSFRPFEDLKLLEIVSRALVEMIGNMSVRLQEYERSDLNEDELFLLTEMAAMGAVICDSMLSFQFSSTVKREYFERSSQTIRSPQAQLAGEALVQLLPLQCARFYIDVLFYNMNVVQRLDKNIPRIEPWRMEYLDRAREDICSILAMYIALSEDSKYQILEYCKKGEIFQGKKFNATFLQDMLNKASAVLFGFEVSKLIKDNYVVFRTNHDNERARVLGHAWVQAFKLGESSGRKLLFMVTYERIYLLNPASSKSCPMCRPEDFCPEPPSYAADIEFDRVEKVHKFVGIPQMFSLMYRNANDVEEGYVMFTEYYSDGYKFWKLFDEIIKEKNYERQETDSIRGNIMELEYNFMRTLKSTLSTEHIYAAVYASFNPKISFNPFAKTKLFDSEALCVITEEKFVVLQLKAGYWNFSDKKIDLPEENAAIYSDLNKRFFGSRKEFDFSKYKDFISLVGSVFKFVAKNEREKLIFIFGDDMALEVFTRSFVLAKSRRG